MAITVVPHRTRSTVRCACHWPAILPSDPKKFPEPRSDQTCENIPALRSSRWHDTITQESVFIPPWGTDKVGKVGRWELVRNSRRWLRIAALD